MLARKASGFRGEFGTDNGGCKTIFIDFIRILPENSVHHCLKMFILLKNKYLYGELLKTNIVDNKM